MNYIFDPDNFERPILQLGDTVTIFDNIYPFKGNIATKHDIPNKQTKDSIGVYLCLDTNNYYLHHLSSEKHIISAYRNLTIKAIATDNSPVTRIPETTEIINFPIYLEDNFLKVLIKRILNVKQLDVMQFKKLFHNENHYNNTKRALLSKSSLSYEKFCEMLDLLGMSHVITILDQDKNIFKLEDS